MSSKPTPPTPTPRRCLAVDPPRDGHEASLRDFIEALRHAMGKCPLHRKEETYGPSTQAWPLHRPGGMFEEERRRSA